MSAESAQLGHIVKTRQKRDSKIREIDWSYLCLQRFDKFWMWSAYNRKRKLCEFAETREMFGSWKSRGKVVMVNNDDFACMTESIEEEFTAFLTRQTTVEAWQVNQVKAMKSSPLLGLFGGSEFYGFFLLKI